MVNLQLQLAFLREQAAQSFMNASATENPNEKYCSRKPNISTFPTHDLEGWFQTQNSDMAGPHQFLPDMSNNSSTTIFQHFYGSISSGSNPLMNLNPIVGNNNENSGTMEESISFSSFDETASNNSMSYDVQANSKQWGFHEADDLQSVAFGFSRSAS